MARRLRSSLAADEPRAEALADDYEALDVTAEEWGDEADEPLSPADRAAIAEEAAELESFAALAASIEQNTKWEALLKALAIAFDKAQALGAERKAIVFTESRRTQAYLLQRLAESPYAEGVVLFNGSNNDPGSRKIYQAWLERHRGSDRVTGSKRLFGNPVRGIPLGALDVIHAMDVDSRDPRPHGGDCPEDEALSV